jgi:hypothetical protein
LGRTAGRFTFQMSPTKHAAWNFNSYSGTSRVCPTYVRATDHNCKNKNRPKDHLGRLFKINEKGLLRRWLRCRVRGLQSGFQALETAALITQTTALAGAFTQEVQLGASGIATTDYINLCDARRMQRENSFHAFVGNNAAHGNGVVYATTLLGDQHALKNLHALFVAFDNFVMHIDGVTHGARRQIVAGFKLRRKKLFD